MGKGDKRTFRGKVKAGSFGNSRKHKFKTTPAPKTKSEKPSKGSKK